MNYNEYIELINNRRSIRSFTDQEVSTEDIKKIIDAARYAPSGMNFQPWEYLVVTDKEVIKNLTTITPADLNIPKILQKQMQKGNGKNKIPKNGIKNAKGAKVLIIALGDTRKQITLPGQRFSKRNGKIKLKKPLNIVNVDGLFYSAMANSFLQMITAASSLGLASQYVTLISSPKKQKEVKKILNIPSYMKIYDVAAIGYPAYKPREKFTRDLEEIIHFDKYDETKSWSDEKIIERANDKSDMKYLDK
jgi:nitroreductase